MVLMPRRCGQLLGAPLGGTCYGKRVVLVGFGNGGRLLSPCLRALGAIVVDVWCGGWAAADRAAVDEVVSAGGGRGELGRGALHAALVPAPDVLLLCLTQTDETRGVVDAAMLCQPPGQLPLYVVRAACPVRSSVACEYSTSDHSD